MPSQPAMKGCICCSGRVFKIPRSSVQSISVLLFNFAGIRSSSLDQVGYYEQAGKIVKMALRIVTAMGIVVMPRVSQYFVEKSFDKIEESLKRSFAFYFFLGFPIMFGLWGIAPDFVPVFFGPGYEKVVSLIVSISPIVIFIGISNCIGKQYMIPTRMGKAYMVSIISGAGLNFTLNLLFIPFFNAEGAVVATVLAEFTVAAVQAYYVRKQLKIFEYIKDGYRYLLMGIAMYVSIWLTGWLLPARTTSVLIEIGVGIFIYVALLFISKDEMMRYVVKIVRKS